MLVELSIKNFALIEDLTLSLQPGLTVLTGETGAGKSIIIDALGAALGERIATDMIRGGADLAIIDAAFDAADCPRALQALDRAGLRQGGDSLIVLTRQISPGRSTCRVNGRPTTLAVLQEVGRHLVDIHGQHEHQTLIHEENHLEFLDHAGDEAHQQLRQAYEKAYAQLRGAETALVDLRRRARERAQRLDLLRFQVEEIGEAVLTADEEEQLQAERKRLGSMERLRELTVEACNLLAGSEQGRGAGEALRQASEDLLRLADIDRTLQANAAELAGAANVVTDTEHVLSRYLDELESDPQRLEEIENRLDTIARLKRKYGDTLADVLSYGEKAKRELAEIEDIESEEERLQAAIEKLRQECGRAGERLSAARLAAGEKLARAVTESIRTLGMPAARFAVAITGSEDEGGVPVSDGRRLRAGPRGLDQVRFLFSANAGEEVRPLAKVASGGELSRVMLAFKSLCTRGTEIPTIIFDEVDAGIGGQTAHKVGEKLGDLACRAQVLCVTHLPQIAGLADCHWQVAKRVEQGRTNAEARQLSETERVAELARMLGAAEDDGDARRHAGNLLAQAAARREACFRR